MHRPLAVVSISLSLFAAVAAVFVLLRESGTPTSIPTPLPATGALVRDISAADLIARLDEVESAVREIAEYQIQLARAVKATAAASKGSGADPEAASADRGAIEAAIDELAQRLDALEAEAENRAQRERTGVAELLLGVSRTTLDVGQSVQTAADRQAPLGERIAALRALRAADARDHATVLAMIELLSDPSVDANTRADIIRNLDGVVFDELRPALIHALETDPARVVREEAIESLQAFYGDPYVHALITRVGQEDADPRVRAEALRRLANWEAERTGERE